MKRFMIAAVFLMGSASLGYAGDDPSIQGATRQGIQEAMTEFVEHNTVDGKLAVYDALSGELKQLTFKELHQGIVKKSGFYVSCADFVDSQGTAYDLDFLVLDRDGDYVAVEAVVHSVGGEKRTYHLEN